MKTWIRKFNELGKVLQDPNTEDFGLHYKERQQIELDKLQNEQPAIWQRMI